MTHMDKGSYGRAAICLWAMGIQHTETNCHLQGPLQHTSSPSTHTHMQMAVIWPGIPHRHPLTNCHCFTEPCLILALRLSTGFLGTTGMPYNGKEQTKNSPTRITFPLRLVHHRTHIQLRNPLGNLESAHLVQNNLELLPDPDFSLFPAFR